jgi:hypothetical protein
LFKRNDPYHFGSLGLSIWTFYRFALFDSWADLWHLNAGGCDDYPTIDIIMDFDRQHQQPIHTVWGTFRRGTCTDPEEQPFMASLVFISFLFLCAYVLVNSCTVAVVVGIKGGLEVFKNMTVFGVDHRIEMINSDEISRRSASGRRSSVGHSVHSAQSTRNNSFGLGKGIFRAMSTVVEAPPSVIQLLHKVWDGVEAKKLAPDLETRYGSWAHGRRVAEELRLVMSHKFVNYFFLYLSLTVPVVQVRGALLCCYVPLHMVQTANILSAVCYVDIHIYKFPDRGRGASIQHFGPNPFYAQCNRETIYNFAPASGQMV